MSRLDWFGSKKIYDMDPTFVNAANFLLLKGNDVADQLTNGGLDDAGRVCSALEGILTRRAVINYRTLIVRYLKYCKLNSNIKWDDRQSVTQFLVKGIKENKWSVRYSRMILSVLNKYVLIDCANKPRFSEIKKKVFKINTNKFDTQSYSDEQIKMILEKINEKKSNDDLFVLVAFLSGTGLRFEETRQFTILQIINIFNGAREPMISCKTRRRDTVLMLSKFRSTQQDDPSQERLTVLNDIPIGDMCVDKLSQGVWVRDERNKPKLLEVCDKLFFKNFESYRSRFQPIKTKIVNKGNGVFEDNRFSTRGSNMHGFRRSFATTLFSNLSNQNDRVRLAVLQEGMRHNTQESTMGYVVENMDDIQTRLIEAM